MVYKTAEEAIAAFGHRNVRTLSVNSYMFNAGIERGKELGQPDLSKAHPHIDLILQYYGEWGQWEVWQLLQSNEWTEVYHPMWNPDTKHELRPVRRMMQLNGKQYPAPEIMAPKKGTDYSVPHPFGYDKIRTVKWTGSEFDRQNLERGIVHLIREAAIAHADAMLAGEAVK